MAKIKLAPPQKIDGVHSAHGYQLQIDGQTINDLCDFSVNFPVNGAVEVSMEVLASSEFEFEIPDADVKIEYTVLPGYWIEDYVDGRGVRIITCKDSK